MQDASVAGMTGLLPDLVRHAVTSKSVFAASQSFGLVVLILLVVLLVEREALRTAGARRVGLIGMSVASFALLIVVALTIAARLYVIVQ